MREHELTRIVRGTRISTASISRGGRADVAANCPMEPTAMRILFVLTALTLGASSAVAGEPAAFCASAKEQVDADPRLAAAVAAVFGKTTFKATSEDCLYPLRALRYASADVLLVQAGAPGEACQGSPRRRNRNYEIVTRAAEKCDCLFGSIADYVESTIAGLTRLRKISSSCGHRRLELEFTRFTLAGTLPVHTCFYWWRSARGK